MACSVNNTNSESYGGDRKGNCHHHLELYGNCTEQNNNPPPLDFFGSFPN